MIAYFSVTMLIIDERRARFRPSKTAHQQRLAFDITEILHIGIQSSTYILSRERKTKALIILYWPGALVCAFGFSDSTKSRRISRDDAHQQTQNLGCIPR